MIDGHARPDTVDAALDPVLILHKNNHRRGTIHEQTNA
jgi:hypothetical protein